ncbi:hypothetical protein B0H16DRAFT_1448268 [Mycena metata]|uniref:Uncharacterized protein n=1 Tax=Mycena metata TaxID=1033252 RepID=A0AAD7NY81_9AGAR|nr:hypothetical protein B0H16DRAFT_1448268 [Mycena metata]
MSEITQSRHSDLNKNSPAWSNSELKVLTGAKGKKRKPTTPTGAPCITGAFYIHWESRPEFGVGHVVERFQRGINLIGFAKEREKKTRAEITELLHRSTALVEQLVNSLLKITVILAERISGNVCGTQRQFNQRHILNNVFNGPPGLNYGSPRQPNSGKHTTAAVCGTSAIVLHAAAVVLTACGTFAIACGSLAA